jgi:hypothetical protein
MDAGEKKFLGGWTAPRRSSAFTIGDGQRPTLIDLGDGHMVRAANAAQALEFAS